MNTVVIIGFAAVAAVTVVAWVIIKLRWVDRRILQARQLADEIEQKAVREAEQAKKEKIIETKDQIFGWRSEAEQEVQGRRRELSSLERRLADKEDNLQSKERALLRKDRESEKLLDKLRRREDQVTENESQMEQLLEERTRRLEAVAGMTAEEAKKTLVDSVQMEARHEATFLVKRIEEAGRP